MSDQGAAQQHNEMIFGVECTVWIGRRSKSVWIAYGNFRDARGSVTGRSANHALSQWRIWAEKQGD